MIKFNTELINGLAVMSALEELQDAAENMAHAIDDMKSLGIDDNSWEFLDKMWNDCMEICDKDTEVIYHENATIDLVVER